MLSLREGWKHRQKTQRLRPLAVVWITQHHIKSLVAPTAPGTLNLSCQEKTGSVTTSVGDTAEG